MQEREILLDLLGGTKHSINCYTNAIMESSNQQLRSTFQTLRDEAEQMQYQLYQMAEQKSYYHPAPGANQNDVQHIKTSLSNGLNGNMNMNFASGGQTNNNNPMINTNMMNTSNITSSINPKAEDNLKSTKKNKKNRKQL